jgi:hypothetical protein
MIGCCHFLESVLRDIGRAFGVKFADLCESFGFFFGRPSLSYRWLDV